jgi:hypothetical protein
VRHRWALSIPDHVRCTRCGVEIRKYRIHRGGLPPCEPKPEHWSFVDGDGPVVACKFCGHEVMNTRFCCWCGIQMHPLSWYPR